MNEYEYINRINELTKQNKELQKQIDKLQSFPPIRPMSGKSVKANFYATQEAVELLNKAVDMAVDNFGFKRFLATAFILEEGLKRLGITQDGEQK